MTQKEIRVGIVGANADVSWAKLSHVPAIKGLPDVKLAAAATHNEHSARQPAEAFGADRWFSDPFAMIRDDQIDVGDDRRECARTSRPRSGGAGRWRSGLLRGAAWTNCLGG
jgi:hypothetical protein